MNKSSHPTDLFDPANILRFLREAGEPTIIGRAPLQPLYRRGRSSEIVDAGLEAGRERGLLLWSLRSQALAYQSVQIVRGCFEVTMTWCNGRGVSEPFICYVPPRQNYGARARVKAEGEVVFIGWEIP